MSPSRPSARPSGGSATLPEAAGESEIPAKGSTVDRYVVLDELGRGGMGVVLAAFDPKLDRKVALKLLRMGSSDEGQARLQREAQALARLAHRHVVRVHDVGRHDGRVFVAMELIAGRTLGQWLRDVRPGWRQILPMFTAAAEGLAAAHAAGLVHRDFKPSNVLVGDDGQVKVTDFGLARVHADAPSILDSLGDQAADLETGPSGALALEATLTRTGALAGTPAYMAPEQLDGRAADPRSDQFSFCVSLFEALAGQRPFPGSTPWAVAESIEAQRYGTSLPGSIPRPLRSALRRGLQADPAARYPDMAALLAALHHGRKARRRQGVALLATALAGGGLWWASTEQQTPETPDYCAQVGERMEGIWDDAVRTEVEQAFTATQLAYAADTYDRIRVRVDSQAFAWVEAQRAACTAEASLPADVEPRQRDALDRTMVCLHRRFSELRQLSLLLREADAKLVERSPVVLDALGPVAACAEAKASPLDPRGSEALEQAEALAAIEMFQEAGRYEEAVEAANTAVEQAKGYSRAAQAVASHARARALDAAGKRDDTERDYHEAFSAAVASGHHVVALQSAIGLAVLMSSGRKPRFDEATLWTDHAEGALERHGGGDEYRGRIANIRGQIEHRRGHYPEALVHFQNAIDLRMADLGPDSYRMANYHNNIGHTLAELERRDEALEHQLRSLALETEHYGDRHPRVASAMAALGSTYSDAGKIDQALSYSTRAVSLLRETVGEDHPNLGTALINLGTAQVRGGKFELAERSFLDALKNAEAVFGPDHRRVGLVLNNLGVHYEMTGQLAEAERYHRRAAEIFTTELGPAHPNTAIITSNLASVLAKENKYDEAEAMLRGTLLALEESLGPDHPHVALPLGVLSEVLIGQQRHRDALPLLERALVLRLPDRASPMEIADTYRALGETLWLTKADRPRGIELVTKALVIYREVGEVRQDQREQTEQWLKERDVVVP